MSVRRLLMELASAGVEVRRDGDQLVLTGPTDHLAEDLLDQVRARKRTLLAMLDDRVGVGAAHLRGFVREWCRWSI